MTKAQLIRQVAKLMKDSGVRREIKYPRYVMHISDDLGNHKDFIIKKTEAGTAYDYDDIEAILSACITVIQNALKEGDYVSVKGLGKLGLRLTKGKKTVNPYSGEAMVIPDRYMPKFTPGEDIKLCAKIFESNLKEGKFYPEFDSDTDMKAGEQ